MSIFPSLLVGSPGSENGKETWKRHRWKVWRRQENRERGAGGSILRGLLFSCDWQSSKVTWALLGNQTCCDPNGTIFTKLKSFGRGDCQCSTSQVIMHSLFKASWRSCIQRANAIPTFLIRGYRMPLLEPLLIHRSRNCLETKNRWAFGQHCISRNFHKDALCWIHGFSQRRWDFPNSTPLKVQISKLNWLNYLHRNSTLLIIL